MMNFENKVIVITGAGQGIGLEYAKFFAARKAKMLLNDPAKEAGQWVVEFVATQLSQEFGVQIATNHDSVEDGHKIIEACIGAFKRIDVLINNAGVLIDRSMAKMTVQDFDNIIRIHLKGSFRCTLAAWPHFRKQKFGRIINTTSSTGLFGNFGQVNYAAAKAGLIGMTMALAKEGANYNIKVNAIAPVAETRMTKTLIPNDLIVAVPANAIPPFVAVLASEECPESGQVYEVGGGWATKLRWERAEGGSFPLNHTPEDIQKGWDQIGDFGRKNDYPTSGSDSIERMLNNYEKQFGQKTENQEKSPQMKPKL
jgi:NAD(P)-dependent dehydrogenase (short-subunit alcohol dehydrogenase family)